MFSLILASVRSSQKCINHVRQLEPPLEQLTVCMEAHIAFLDMLIGSDQRMNAVDV